jgi:hypothetical protein
MGNKPILPDFRPTVTEIEFALSYSNGRSGGIMQKY